MDRQRPQAIKTGVVNVTSRPGTPAALFAGRIQPCRVWVALRGRDRLALLTDARRPGRQMWPGEHLQ